MIAKEVVVNNEGGIHLRVAGAVVKVARQHDCNLRVSCENCPAANGCSVMELLTLGVESGRKVRIEADGPGAEAAVSRVAEIFSEGSGI